MHLTTQVPSAEMIDGQIMLSFPSGPETIHIAINGTNHAQILARQIMSASADLFAARAKPLPRAEIIALAARRA